MGIPESIPPFAVFAMPRCMVHESYDNKVLPGFKVKHAPTNNAGAWHPGFLRALKFRGAFSDTGFLVFWHIGFG